MKLKTGTCDLPILKFLTNQTGLVIKNDEEYQMFKSICNTFGLNIRCDGFSEWARLACLNASRLGEKYRGYLVFEYCNHKGLTFGYSCESAREWFGDDVLTVYDLIENK